MGTVQVFVTMGLIIAALSIALVLPMSIWGGSTTPTVTTASTSSSSSTSVSIISTSTTSTGMSSTTNSGTSTYADSIHGLELRLSINANEVYVGGTIQVNVSEFNTLGTPNNVSKSGQWVIQASLGSCPNVYVQPFGVAVYQGYYTAQNVTQGTQLQIYPITACPMFIRLVTGYVFQPNSDLAAVLPGSGSTPMNGSVDVVNATSVGFGQSQPLNPGRYTVVAADEWGGIAFLYFQVNGLP